MPHHVNPQAPDLSLNEWLNVPSPRLLQDYLSAWIGTSGAPSFTAVVVTLGCMLAINATFYVFMMHLLFTLLLRGLGYNTRPGPKFLQNILGQSHPVLDRRPG